MMFLVILGFMLMPAQGSSLADGVVAAWHMDEAGGSRIDALGVTTLVDSNSVGQASGVLSTSSHFIHTSQQSLYCASSPVVSRGDTSWTFGCWVRLTTAGAQREVFAKQSGSTSEYILRYEADGRLHWYVFTGQNHTVVGQATSAAIALNVWYSVLVWYDADANQVGIQLNDLAPVLGVITGVTNSSSVNFRVGARESNISPAYWSGDIDELVLWGRGLTFNERAQWYKNGSGQAYPFGGGVPNGVPFTVIAPTPYQIIQRSGCHGTISVMGTAPNGSVVEARWRNGPWVALGVATDGVFAGALTGQAVGQGALDVRIIGGASTAIANVGIGDIYIVAGQSNASGRGVIQSYEHAVLRATIFSNAYTWQDLNDPIDSSLNQVDAVSVDAASGSVWPLVAQAYLNNSNIPVAFVPCAKGASSIMQWLPGANHQDRSTLYGSMVYRALVVGGVRGVLWWQGETDALAGMSSEVYGEHLATLANAISSDLGVKLIPCTLQNSMALDDAAEASINAAISNAWIAHPAVVAGPVLNDITSDDNFHLTTTAKLELAASRWWIALRGLAGV